MSDPSSVDDPMATNAGDTAGGPADPEAGVAASADAVRPARKRRAQRSSQDDRTDTPPAGADAVTTRPKDRAVPVPVMAPPTTEGGNGGLVRTDRLSIVQGGADRVDAGSITISQGGIRDATAGSVEIRQGGIGRLEAEDVHVTQGGIGFARGDRVSIELGGMGAALANDLRITQGAIGTVIARRASIEQALVRTVIAQHVHFARPGGVLVMLAARVSGDVRPVLDWRGALAFGAVFGVIAGLFRGVRRRA